MAADLEGVSHLQPDDGHHRDLDDLRDSDDGGTEERPAEDIGADENRNPRHPGRADGVQHRHDLVVDPKHQSSPGFRHERLLALGTGPEVKDGAGALGLTWWRPSPEGT